MLLITVVGVGLALDLVSKSWAFDHVAAEPVILNYEDIMSGGNPIPYHDGVRVLSPDLLDFRLVLNRGAVFGIGQGRRLAFVAFTMIAIAIAVSVFGWWTRARSVIAHVAIGLILAGGIGNLYDRLAIGAVRDFLHMFPRRDLPLGLSWPRGDTGIFPWVFNVADAELLVGMGMLLVFVHLSDRIARQQALVAKDDVITDSPSASEERPEEE